MKKALIVLLLLAVAGGLFAQGFTIGGRVDAYWIPFQYVGSNLDLDEDDTYATETLLGAGLGRDSGDAVGNRARLFGSAQNEDGTLGARIYLQFFPGNSATGALDAFGFDDFVDVWWKPFPQLTLDVGKYVNDTLRGKVGDHWFRKFTVGSYNNDAIFTRFAGSGVDIGGTGDLGVLALFQLNDLTVGVNFPQLKPFGAGSGAFGSGIGGWDKQNTVYEANTFADGRGDLIRAYQRTQVAVGYNIPDIGLARLQFVGANPSITGVAGAGQVVRAPRLEAAFALTAVEGLTLDLGYKFVLPQSEGAFKGWNKDKAVWEAESYVMLDPTANNASLVGPGDDKIAGTDDDVLPEYDDAVVGKIRKGTYKAPMQVGLGGIYTAGAFTFNGRVDVNFGGMASQPETAANLGDGVELKQGLELNAHIWPTYDLGFMVLGLDFGIAYKGDSTVTVGDADPTTTVNGMRFGGGLFVNKAIGGCTIRAGLAYSHASVIGETNDTPPQDKKSDTVFSVPVVFEYVF